MILMGMWKLVYFSMIDKWSCKLLEYLDVAEFQARNPVDALAAYPVFRLLVLPGTVR